MAAPRILLVDDDPEDRDVMRDALEQLDARNEIICAENGEAALKLLTDHEAPANYPCLIVLDLNMPKMNGTQTLQQLKADERFRHIAVVIYSTSVNLFEKDICMKSGAHAFITKPITYKESINTARLFLDLCGKGRDVAT
jgi:CheY-like chemotaxis protein